MGVVWTFLMWLPLWLVALSLVGPNPFVLGLLPVGVGASVGIGAQSLKGLGGWTLGLCVIGFFFLNRIPAVAFGDRQGTIFALLIISGLYVVGLVGAVIWREKRAEE